MRPNLRRPDPECRALIGKLNSDHNRLISKRYFWVSLFRNWLLQASPRGSYMVAEETWQDPKLFDFAERNTTFACVKQSGFLPQSDPSTMTGRPIAGGGRFCHLNLTYCGDTKTSKRADDPYENVNLNGKT